MVPAGPRAEAPRTPEMEAFFQAVSEIKEMLAHIKDQEDNLKVRGRHGLAGLAK